MKCLVFLFASCLLFSQEKLTARRQVAKDANLEQTQPSPKTDLPDCPSAEQKSFLKYHHSASIGYRRDRQKFQTPLAKQLITDRNSIELILGSNFEWKWVVFNMRAFYGWLIDGTFKDKINDLHFSEEFSLGAGYSADAMGTGGFRIKFLTRENLAFSLIASGGYKYSHIMNFPEGLQISPIVDGITVGSIPKPNQQDWFGPLVEGRFEFLFWDNLSWDLFGQYHWVTLRSLFKESYEVFSSSVAESIQISSIYKTADAHRVVGGTDIRYSGPTGWNFGVHFEGSSAWEKAADSKRKISATLMPTETMDFTETAKIKWVSYELSLFLGYQF